jgi:hypothetical protein
LRPSRPRLALWLVVLMPLAGCGGGSGGKDDPALAPPQATSGHARAVNAWADAAQRYWGKFRDCGSGANPVRSYFASCTKGEQRALRQSERQALRGLRGPAAACKQVGSLIRRTDATLERAVKAFDASNDAGIAHRPYRGAPPQSLYLDGERSLAEDLPRARQLSPDVPVSC